MDPHEDFEAMAVRLRRFNRFYMRKIRPLRDAMRGPAMHASYLRVLRELGEAEEGATATWIAEKLNMHPSLVCRILAWYRALRYLKESRHPADGRRKIIELNPSGRAAYERCEKLAAGTAAFMLMLLLPEDRARVLAAMATIEYCLSYARWDDIRPPSISGPELFTPCP